MKKYKLKSGVFEIRPKKLLHLAAGGMICLTPKKTYHAFRTDCEISNQPGKETIMIVKDSYRWFPVVVTYATNNFDFIKDGTVINQNLWIDSFNRKNEHIKCKEDPIEIAF